MTEIKPPNIGTINTDPGIQPIPPAEAEIRRLQQLLHDHQKQATETARQLETKVKEQTINDVMEMKKRGQQIDEYALQRLMQ